MEDVSKVKESALLHVDLPVHPYLLDHRFEDRFVLPAVEAMQALAAAARRFRPDADLSAITHARFDKFLYIDPGVASVPASIEVAQEEDGGIRAALLTRSRSGKLGIARSRCHAALSFPPAKPRLDEPPSDLAAALEGVCFEIPPEKIYQDLVPFGASFQNVRECLLSKDGAIARVAAPPAFAGAEESALLGSSFPLDAAFHAACAWGQRYAGIVAFPVGIDRRVMPRPTRPGSVYVTRILPVRVEPGLLVFDIWIYDGQGELHEGACGVSMRDVSAGRMKPPGWVVDPGAGLPLERILNRVLGASVVELRSVQPFAEKALSVRERERFQRMGEPRRRSYLAARLACKRLYRVLCGNDLHTPATEITTIGPDRIRPCLPLERNGRTVSCSVSHDDRFGVAVAAGGRVGVDVERISERVLRSRQLYMDESEQRLLQVSGLGESAAAARVWTLKEAAAKAFDMTLADSWDRVRVQAVGVSESGFRLADGSVHTAAHDEVEGHLFTLVCQRPES